MFRKPVNVKSHVQLKSSEKRKILTELRNDFPSLTDDDIAVFNKDTLTRCKLTTARDVNVDVYMVGVVPMFFEVQDSNRRLPTLFMAWDFPHVAPSVTTSGFVTEKLKLGADLFVPGVIVEGLQQNGGNFGTKDAVLVNTVQNAATMAVGFAGCSAEALLEKGVHQAAGVAVKVMHVVGDFLHKMCNAKKLPQLGPPAWASEVRRVDSPSNDSATQQESEEVTEPVCGDSGEERTSPAPETKPEPDQDPQMDDTQLLEYCFIKAAKTAPKTMYPVLPATFYANHVLSAVPPDYTLNIKKTKWKKFSAFLEEKSQQGLIKLESIQKNEFKILGFDYSKPEIREFLDKFSSEIVVVPDKVGSDGQPVVQQIYSVSAAVLPFFVKQGLRKQDEVTRNDVRNYLNEYIKRENLQHATAKDKVVLDPVLTHIIKGNAEVLSRGDLLAALLEKMSVQHRVSNTSCGETISHKGKMPLIEFELATKTGNKKITKISNLESYGLEAAAFAKELQLKAAASTTLIQEVPGKKGPQVIVQGNQINIAVAILKEKNILEKFMRGLDKAPKSKKVEAKKK